MALYMYQTGSGCRRSWVMSVFRWGLPLLVGGSRCYKVRAILWLF